VSPRPARAFTPFWLAGLGLCAVMLLIRQADLPLLRQLDGRLNDAGLRMASSGVTNDAPLPIVIDIDQKSLTEFGGWPWPRYRLARLLDLCMERGAPAVGFDILFVDPDALSFSELGRRMERDFGVDSQTNLPEKLWDNDALLSQALTRHPAVLAFFAGFAGQDLPELQGDKASVPFATLSPPGAPSPLARLPRTQTALLPIQGLVRAGGLPGSINSLLDSDGVVRRLPMLIRHGENVMASFSLRMLMAMENADTVVLECDAQGLAAVIVGNVRVPLSAEGVFLPWFKSGRGVEHISAAEILSGRAGANLLRGRPVLIGSSAVGLKDIRSTSMQAQTAGVDIHAVALDNMLRGRFMRRPSWEGSGVVAATVLAVAAMVAAVYTLPPVGAFSIMVLMCGLFWGGSLFGARSGLVLSPLYPLLAAVASFTLLTGLRARLEAGRKKILKNAFSRYLAPEMVRRITERPGDIKLMGEEKELSILFLDIRGFTTISSHLPPEAVVSLLNRVFTPVTRIIREHSGTVDKFVGDACLAFWNAPLDVPGHALKAAQAAVQIFVAVAGLNTAAPPLPAEVRIGIGLHCGVAHVGNMGTEELLNYTCIGDAVNLASRIEDLCKTYNAACLASGPFVQACLRDAGAAGLDGAVLRAGELEFEYLDTVTVRGHDRPQEIYAVRSGQ